MPLSAIGSKIVLRQVDAPTRSGLLHLPEQHAKRPSQGTVISVGPDVGAGVEAGQVVWFRKYAGDEVEIGGVTLLICEEDDVLAIDGPLPTEG